MSVSSSQAGPSTSDLGTGQEREGGQGSSWCLRVGRAGCCLWGAGDSAGTPVSPGSRERRRQGWQSFHANPRVNRGQDVAMVRLSPEKGHSGARGGGSAGPPCWLTGTSRAPPIPPVPPNLRRQSPQGRVGGSGNGYSPSPGQLQFKVKVQSEVGEKVVSMWVAVYSACPHPRPHRPPGCLWGKKRCRVSLALRTREGWEGGGGAGVFRDPPALEDGERPPLLSHIGQGPRA